LLLCVGCDSTTTTTTPSPDLASVKPSDGGTATHTLTLNDYLSWCSVTVNSGTASTTATQTLTFPAGTVVNLGGDKASSTFVWGYWVGTTGDTSATHDKAMTTTVKMDQDRTVQACCPFATAPSTPCPL
jgi:hypothetical protein